MTNTRPAPNALSIFVLQQRIATLRTQADRSTNADQEARIRRTVRNLESRLRKMDPSAVSQ